MIINKKGISDLQSSIGIFFTTLNSTLLGSTSTTFFIKISWVIFSFLSSVLLARMVGVKEFGIYTYVLSWVYLLVSPAMFGFDSLLVREVAIYNDKAEWRKLHGLLKKTTEVVLAASVVIIVITLSIVFLWASEIEALANGSFVIAILFLPVLALARLRHSIMQGLHKVVSSQLPELVVQPILFIVALLLFYFFANSRITALSAVSLNMGTIFIAFLIGLKMVKNALPEEVKISPPVFDTWRWITDSFPMLIISCMVMINSQIGIIMLGSIVGAENAGIYAVAINGSEVVSFILYSANVVLGPQVARFYNSGDTQQLKKIIHQGAKIIFLLSAPAAIFLMIFGYWFLLLFGEDFTSGLTPLWILCVGQIVNSFMGPAGITLMMTGHERIAARCIIICGFINMSLSIFLIPSLGMKGAALAAAASGVIASILMAWMVHKKIKIYSPAFGINPVSDQTSLQKDMDNELNSKEKSI